MKLSDVNSRDIPIIWPLVQGYVESAMERGIGEYDIVDVFNSLMEGTMRLWIVYTDEGEVKGATICELHQYPRMRVAVVLYSAGVDFESWGHYVECLEDWALHNGAEVLIAYTRPGLAKKLKDHGFTTTQHVVSKQISRGKRLH